MFHNKKVIAFCDLHTTPTIRGLNETRALGTVAFLGRFAIMDFTLSNFSNSGIDRVGILVHRFPHSVLSHVENGQPWINNTKIGFQYIMYNEEGVAKPSFNTDIANIVANKAVLEREDYDLIVVAPVHYLASIDYREIIDDHIAKNAKVTVVYNEIDNGKTAFPKSRLLEVDGEGNVKRFVRNSKVRDNVKVSLDTFIIDRNEFEGILQKHVQLSKSSPLRDLIAWLVSNENLKVNAYRFEHKVFPILSLQDYFDSSFACLKYENRQKLFKPDWPIYTTSHDTPPAKYGPNADTKNSVISNGAIINGRVRNSILSRNVIVEKGAVVENSILFSGTHVVAGSKIAYVLTEKRNEIQEDLIGDKNNLLVITKGRVCKI